jgi:serine/threonine protein phosphatase 1
MNTNPVLRLDQNVLGRDFVIGDIHGAYDLVIAGMKEVRFNTLTDRILCTGDLIDRGAGSFRCLKFLERPYVFAVSGNHDYDFSKLSYEEIQTLASVNFNGMKWAKDLSREQLTSLQIKLASLPIAMEVPTERGLVGIVHADVPAGWSWQKFTKALEEGDSQALETALYGRDRIQDRDDSGVDGVGRVFVGHTVVWNGPQRFCNVYAVDSGAVFAEIFASKKDRDIRGFLTMANVCAHSGLLVKSASDESLRSRLITHTEPESLPFSTYQNRP